MSGVSFEFVIATLEHDIWWIVLKASHSRRNQNPPLDFSLRLDIIIFFLLRAKGELSFQCNFHKIEKYIIIYSGKKSAKGRTKTICCVYG